MLRRVRITPYGKRWQLPKLRHSDHPGDNWCISNPDLSFLNIPFTLRVFSSHFPSLEAIFGVDFRHKHGFHYSVGHLFLMSHLFPKKISFTACNFSLNYILTIGNTLLISTLLIYQTTFSYFRVMKKNFPKKCPPILS